jgi:hypothetical protein
MLTWLAAVGFAADPFVRWPDHTDRDAWGAGYGISVSDIDGDGWTDVAVPYSRAVWLNDAAGGWNLVTVPQVGVVFQYGASLGDYDGDGLPDWSTEPRGGAAKLLHNEGGGAFSELPVESFPVIGSQSAETNGWADVDGDGRIDLFVPAYYGQSGLYMNLGPDKGGVWRFDEVASEVGIDLSVSGAFRPEGAQLVDVDRDGDPDLYVCGELLRNESVPGAPWFVTDETAGIIPAFDEGAAFADIDMDGDFDLGVLYHGQNWDASLPTYAMLVWRNQGDATFTLMPPGTLEDFDLTRGYNLGMSFADWDHDGDADITFSDRFQANQWRESGRAEFTTIVTGAAQVDAVPGWFDWDRDGDLDIALGVWGGEAQFYQSMLYDDVLPEDRLYLRVRPLDPSADVPEGLETAYAATVEVAVHGEDRSVRRRQFTASGHGYLNQSEYTVSFGLEGLKDPVVDVSVDFANPGVDGAWRVDRHINPALGDLDVRALSERTVQVLRDGRVVVDGVETAPVGDEDPLLQTPGGLWAPTVDDALVESPDTWVGLVVTLPEDETDPEHGAALREVVVEGALEPAVTCGDYTGNVLVFDTTDTPTLVGAALGATAAGNRRTDVPADVWLRPGRSYRVVARVGSNRTFEPGAASTRLLVEGAVQVSEVADPCDPTWVADAPVSEGAHALSVRYRDRVVPVPPPDDTGDTGETTETGETEPPDTEDTEPPDTGDSGPVVDSDPDSEPAPDTAVTGTPKGGCGCASGGPSGAAAGASVLGVLVTLRRGARSRAR